MVRPQGSFVMDIYKKDLFSYCDWKYLLRPITRGIRKEHLYYIISKITPALIPIAKASRTIGGSILARLIPIVEYSHLGLNNEQNREWSILDTFDMYSPAFDNPKSIDEVYSWFKENNFENIDVNYGPNGVIGKGIKKVIV